MKRLNVENIFFQACELVVNPNFHGIKINKFGKINHTCDAY